MTSVNCNSYISPKCSVFGQRLKNSAENKNVTYSTSNNPTYSNNKGTSIAPLHITGRYRYCHFWFICWNVSLCAAEKAFQLLFKKQIRQNIKQWGEMWSEVQFWCNIMKKAAQQSQINSAAHVKWFNVTLWCDTHIWTWKLWKGKILHPSPDHREGVTFSYSKAIFHFDSLLSFNLAKQFPLTWWDRVDGGTEAQRLALLRNWIWLLHVRGNPEMVAVEVWCELNDADTGSSACAHLGIKTSDFCVKGKEICHSLTCLDLCLVPASWLRWANVGHSRPSCLSCKSKHLLP